MADTIGTTGTPAAAAVSERTAFSRTGEVLRDIARGGIAGGIVGVVVGGLGARLLMRLVTILHTEAVGAFTDNGNRIGDITLGGTLFLIVFGLISGVLAGGPLGHRQPLDPAVPRSPGVPCGRCRNSDRDAIEQGHPCRHRAGTRCGGAS